jgi:hypothetical protein
VTVVEWRAAGRAERTPIITHRRALFRIKGTARS